MKQFDYVANIKTYRGALLTPKQVTPAAAIVLLPDWRGQSSLAFDHARSLVELGCAVVIADLYGDGFSPTSLDQVGAMVQTLVDNRDMGVAALHACMEQLRSAVADGTRLYCLGYSAGGMITLDYARTGVKLDGFILCSTLLKPALPGQSIRINAPVLILQGTQDVVSPMSVINALISEMDSAKNDVRFVLYSQTHHAFDNPEAGTDETARLAYSPGSAARARSSIAQFVLGADANYTTP